MPVRIYEIAKQLGIPNKEVIARAKELGISNAKVPSSSIDKITAEYLIKEMGGGDTQETPAQEAAQEAIVVVKDESETISDASSSSEDDPTEPTESEASEEGSIKVIHADEPVGAETSEDVAEETTITEAVDTSQGPHPKVRTHQTRKKNPLRKLLKIPRMQHPQPNRRQTRPMSPLLPQLWELKLVLFNSLPNQPGLPAARETAEKRGIKSAS